jgi:hypothetical protein
VLPRHRQWAPFELFVRDDAVKTILLEAEALAGAGRTLLREKICFRKHSLLLCGVPLLGYPQQRRKSVIMTTEYWKIYRIFYLEPLFCAERLTRKYFLQ